MTGEEKKIITRLKHPGHVAQGHKLAVLMKKRKEEILRNKEHSTGQSTVQPSVQSSVQSAVQSNYVYGVGRLAVFATSVCVFLHTTLFILKIKNKPMKKRSATETTSYVLKKIQ